MKRTKTKPKTERRKRKLRFQTLWAKPHRFSASVTEEQDWHTEVPNVKLARVFGIVLILHIVAVGGILAFKMIERTSSESSATPAVAKSEANKLPEAPAPAAAARPRTDADANVIVDDPSRLGMRHYRVRSGDNLLAVARRLDVSVSELEELNELDKGKELYPGLVLLVPNRKISADPNEEIQKLIGQPATVARAEPATEPSPAPASVSAPAPPSVPTVTAAPTMASAPRIARAEPIAPPKSTAAPVLKPVTTPASTRAPVLQPVAVTPAEAPAAAPVAKPVTPAPAVGSPASAGTYVVQSGDTPYGIARKFSISHAELMSANGISDPRSMQVGQTLKIPNN